MASPAEQWFKLADQDGDGAVGGAEAVRFFTRSGLPQDVLGQIWEFASGGGAKLNPMQFNTALRLVALAQSSGGRLPPDQARVVAMGAGPQLPPPRLAGLTETPPTPSIPTYTPQITGLTPQPTGGVGYTPQMTGGMPYTPQATGVRPPYPGPRGYMAPAMTGSGPPSGGMVPPTMPGPGAGLTGGPGVSAGYTGMSPAAAAGPTGGLVYPPGYTPPSAADMQRYLAVFSSTDGDRDGLVKGSECFPLFIQSGLDKGLLKRMWDLVAGNAGHLNRDQFVRCMFLMDGMRRGLQLPAVLPPGPWPQVAPAAAGMTGPQPGSAYQTAAQQQPVPATAAGLSAASPGAAAAGLTGPLGSRPSSLGGAAPTGGMIPGAPGMPGMPGPMAAGMAVAGATGFGSRPGSTGGAVMMPPPVGGVAGGPLRQESWSLSSQFGQKGAVKAIREAYDQTLPKIPEPPGKVTYEGKAMPDSGPSAVPDLDVAVSSMLAPADKARWEAERAEALKKEQEQRLTEAEAANQKARLAAFQEALSELVMYKSKVDVALLQADDSAARLQSEAEDLELRYNRAQLAAQAQADAGSKARKQLQDLLTRKAEAITKLQVLQQELEMAQNLNPEELVALEREVGGLMAQTAAAEARKAALDMQLDSGRKQKTMLSERISQLDMAAAAGEGELRRAQEELEQLQGKVLSAEASTLNPDELGQVKPLLGKAASAYRRLYSTAAAAGIEVPYEANLNNVGSLVWLEQLMAGTADWVDDDSALSGYSVVNALPELEGVPPALMRAAALAAAAAPPIKPNIILGAQAAAKPAAAGEKGAEVAATADAAAAVPVAAEVVGSKEAAAVDAAAAAAPATDTPAAAAAAVPEAAAKEVPAKVEGAPATAAAAAPAAPAAAKEASKAAADGSSSSASKKTGAVAAAAAATAAVAAGAAAVAGVAAARKGSAGEEVQGAGSSTAAADDAAAPAAVLDTPIAAEVPAAAAATGGVGNDDIFSSATAAPPAPAAAAPEADSTTTGAATAAAAADIIEARPATPPAAVEEGEEAVSSPPAAAVSAPKTLLEDSDSELPDEPASSEALGGPFSGSDAPAFGGLAGFDPSLYRLPDEQRTLAAQHSIDSSYAGSFTAERRRSSIEAGGTGASGFEHAFDEAPPAFGTSSSTGGAAAAASGAGAGATGASVSGVGGSATAGSSTAGAAADMGFEDNAF